jgi:hypothetical protein
VLLPETHGGLAQALPVSCHNDGNRRRCTSMWRSR